MIDMQEFSVSGLLNQARTSKNPFEGASKAWEALNKIEAEGVHSEVTAQKHLDLLLPDLASIRRSENHSAGARDSGAETLSVSGSVSGVVSGAVFGGGGDSEGAALDSASGSALDSAVDSALVVATRTNPLGAMTPLAYVRARFAAEERNDYASLFIESISPIIAKGREFKTPDAIKSYLEKEAAKMEATCHAKEACLKSGSCKTPKGLKAIRDTLAALPLLSDESETIWNPEAVWNHLKSAGSKRAKSKKDMRYVIGEFLDATPDDAQISAQEIKARLLDAYIRRQTVAYTKNKKAALLLAVEKLAAIPDWIQATSGQKDRALDKGELFSLLSDVYMKATGESHADLRKKLCATTHDCFERFIKKDDSWREFYEDFWSRKPEYQDILREKKLALKQDGAASGAGRSFWQKLFGKPRKKSLSPV